jgi:hypothetical protein
VNGVILGGSVGRGEQWPLSDIDVIVVCAGRARDAVSTDIDRRAYQLSEMWGSAGIYTAVDAGRLVFDEEEIRAVADPVAALRDDRWFHALDKVYGGSARRDGSGAAAALLDLANRWRFQPDLVRSRIGAWTATAERALDAAEEIAAVDPIGSWIAIRRAATAIAEAATELWGERAGSLGRYWTQFEARADRHGENRFAGALLEAATALPQLIPDLPEWLTARIELSWEARTQVGERVSREQNVRDNVLAFAGLYRGRFPDAAEPWLCPPGGADIAASATALRHLQHQFLERLPDA